MKTLPKPDVALFGLGVQGARHWMPTLLAHAHRTDLHVYLVDTRESPGEEVRSNLRTGYVDYVPWADRSAIRSLDGAIICAPASVHAVVIEALCSLKTPPRWAVCEKPGGDSIEAYLRILDMSERSGMQIGFSDHYLLKPSIQRGLQATQGENSHASPSQLVSRCWRRSVRALPTNQSTS
jgi:predicted dehydrogenase